MFVLMHVISTTFMGHDLRVIEYTCKTGLKKALFRGSEILSEILFEAKGFFTSNTCSDKGSEPKETKTNALRNF